MRELKVPANHVALSADDTKLLPAFRVFLNREENKWYIVGGTGDPYLVSSMDELRKELKRADMEKATKVQFNKIHLLYSDMTLSYTFCLQVRVWVVTIPLPKIPPIVLGALAISEKMTTDDLFMYTMKVIEGLHEHGIWPVSYACDGTAKERANQRRLLAEAHSTDTRRIEGPQSRAPDLTLRIPTFHGKPMALVQDSLHARKTGRNNIQYGTKTMVLGDFPVLLQHLLDMARSQDSPIYLRDVQNADKQDDRAAARLCSADALKWLLETGPQYFGTAVYLFVIGELIDAIQNRTIPFPERARMILRAYYFIHMWRRFLKAAGYERNRHCVSNEALDIFQFIINGFFESLFIYRDYFSGKKVPLLPWLHSSEPCEHVFAECRKITKDFDFQEFLRMMPKVHAKLNYELQFRTLKTEDAKRRASGYIHTWMDSEGLEDLALSNLAVFPTDDELKDIAKSAFDDAEELWMLLEVFPQDIDSVPGEIEEKLEEPPDSDDEDADEVLPSISHLDRPSIQDLLDSLPSGMKKHVTEDNEIETSDSDAPSSPETANKPGGSSSKSGLSILEAERIVLEQLFEEEQEAYENGPIRLETVDKTMLNVSCAKLFLDFDTNLQM